MASERAKIEAHYGNRIRVRACGIALKEDKILLLKHNHIGTLGYFWNTPGGSPEEGETLTSCIEREFREEVGLAVSVTEYFHCNEYVDLPLHAVELYFFVKILEGNTKLGSDPELSDVQILTELKWFSKSEFNQLPEEAKPCFLEEVWKV